MQLGVDLKHVRIGAAERHGYAPDLRRALARLDSDERAGFLRVLHRGAVLREIRSFAAATRRSWSDVVQLGIGGSSLGGHALCRALLPSGPDPRVGPRFHFPDNVDPESFGALLERLDPRRTLVHVVSKSGATLETVAQLHALLEAFGGRRLAPLRERMVVTTGRDGTLREFAESEGIPILLAPDDVPGRYSVFTASGLLVPALCGVPVGRVVAGARRMEARCRAARGVGPAGQLAALHYLHDAKYDRPIHVELIYADALQLLGEWFRQLWAESLGKRGRGPTPITARGTTDQHSQVQLYAEGPDDKLYPVLRVDRLRRRLRVGRGAPAALAGRDLGAVFDAEARGTAAALRSCGRPLIEIRLPRITPQGIGELLLMQQLQTALAGDLYGVDPFTQPGVEAGKRAALRILERESAAGRARRGSSRTSP